MALSRHGDTITLHTSADGVTWTEQKSVTLPGLAASVNVGLCISSGTAGVDAKSGRDRLPTRAAAPAVPVTG